MRRKNYKMPNEQTDFNVLFADCFGNRHCEFRVKGGNKRRPIQRHVHSLSEFKQTLSDKKWDAVFIPSYWGTTARRGISADKEDMQEAIEALLNLPLEKRPDLVIYHGLTDHSGLVSTLRANGFLATHIPWDVNDLSKHSRADKKREVSKC